MKLHKILFSMISDFRNIFWKENEAPYDGKERVLEALEHYLSGGVLVFVDTETTPIKEGTVPNAWEVSYIIAANGKEPQVFHAFNMEYYDKRFYKMEDDEEINAAIFKAEWINHLTYDEAVKHLKSLKSDGAMLINYSSNDYDGTVLGIAMNPLIFTELRDSASNFMSFKYSETDNFKGAWTALKRFAIFPDDFPAHRSLSDTIAVYNIFAKYSETKASFNRYLKRIHENIRNEQIDSLLYSFYRGEYGRWLKMMEYTVMIQESNYSEMKKYFNWIWKHRTTDPIKVDGYFRKRFPNITTEEIDNFWEIVDGGEIDELCYECYATYKDMISKGYEVDFNQISESYFYKYYGDKRNKYLAEIENEYERIQE